ncbi:hypothetical protein GCM10022213_01140 [Parerythrobacter jejuensis]
MQPNNRFKKLLMAPLLAVALTGGAAAPAQAQIPSALPYIGQKEPQDPLPIDGTWRIRENNELIIIDRGHAYAVDGWVHTVIFRIMPRQVVMADLRERADGTIEGRDLPLMAPITMIPIDDYTLQVTARGLIPITYHLELVEAGEVLQPEAPDQDDSWFSSDDSRDDRRNESKDESWFPADEDG